MILRIIQCESIKTEPLKVKLFASYFNNLTALIASS